MNKHAQNKEPRKTRKAVAHPIEISAECAVSLFENIENEDISAKSTVVIAREIENAKLTGAYAARAFDVAMGILRWKTRLDKEINRHTTKGRLDLPAFEKNLLRAAAYELTVRKEDEPAGLINEIVEISKKRSNAAFAGLINAVLRKMASTPPLPAPSFDADATGLTDYYSVDAPFIQKMLGQRGKEWTGTVLNSANERILHQMRVNPFLEDNEGYPETLGAVMKTFRSECYWESQALTREIREANTEGRIVVQSLPSQAAAIILDPRPGDKVLDAASGTGIKAHHLLSLIAGWGELTLTDISPNKREDCYKNFEKWNAPEPDYRLVNLADEAAVRDEFEDREFDAILLDVPCSGSGLIHHLPEKRYTSKIGRLSDYRQIQQKMLKNCLSLLSAEGTLVYSTCSIWDEENEQVTSEVLLETGHCRTEESLRFEPRGHQIGFYIEKIRRLE